MAYLVIISRRYEYYWILFPFYSKSTIPRSMSSLLKKKVFFTNWISLIQLWLISENTPVKSMEYQLKPIWMSKVCISFRFHSKLVEKIKQMYLCTEISLHVYYILLSDNIIFTATWNSFSEMKISIKMYKCFQSHVSVTMWRVVIISHIVFVHWCIRRIALLVC